MIKSRNIFIISAFIAVLTALSVSSYAQTEYPLDDSFVRPSFPSCAAPQGDLKVFYTTGIHGIPGQTATYTGSDSVHNLTEDTLTQCFCAVNGDGIQTDWWKVSSLSLTEVEILQNEGWIYIPNGAEWGLEEAPYMALNDPYDCGEGEDDDDDDNDDGDDDDDDDNDSDGDDDDDDGDVLGTSDSRIGGILGLAATGNIKNILLGIGIFGLSVTSLYLLVSKQRE